MKAAEFLRSVGTWEHSAHWWEREAARALSRDHVQLINARQIDNLYLARFWITQPKPYRDGDDDRWDSSDSLLLHYFKRPDDDGALHDHPWNFRTTVLVGGYREQRPSAAWRVGSPYGPRDTFMINHGVGALIERQATDLHRVDAIEAGTWTLVRTGPKMRSWGFHPPGQKWVPWRTYIDQARGGESTPIMNAIEAKDAQ